MVQSTFTPKIFLVLHHFHFVLRYTYDYGDILGNMLTYRILIGVTLQLIILATRGLTVGEDLWTSGHVLLAY